MDRRKAALMITGLLLPALLAGDALAFGPPGGHRGAGRHGAGHRGPGGGFMHRVWDLPGLTEKQEERIDELAASMRKEMRAMQKQGRKLREELDELIKNGAGDAEIAEKVDQAAQVHAERMKKQALLMRDVAEVLTKEQRETLFEAPDVPPHHGKQGKGRR